MSTCAVKSDTHRPLAGLSVDLDNLWTYLRTFGDARWREYSDFLVTSIPRLLDLFDELGTRGTFFVVGRDIESPSLKPLLGQIARCGHEIGNHSYDHSLRFATFDEATLADDLERSENRISELGVAHVEGFRAPSFGIGPALATTLAQRGYRYDSSSLPSIAGPLARAWLRRRSASSEIAAGGTSVLFGGWSAARRQLHPHVLDASGRRVVELPVTTMPVTRLPVHWTYLHHLAGVSTPLARTYFRLHRLLLTKTRTEPILLLHATDLLGSNDPGVPTFLPGMKLDSATKTDFVRKSLARYGEYFDFVTLAEFARSRNPGEQDLRS